MIEFYNSVIFSSNKLLKKYGLKSILIFESKKEFEYIASQLLFLITKENAKTILSYPENMPRLTCLNVVTNFLDKCAEFDNIFEIMIEMIDSLDHRIGDVQEFQEITHLYSFFHLFLAFLNKLKKLEELIIVLNKVKQLSEKRKTCAQNSIISELYNVS